MAFDAEQEADNAGLLVEVRNVGVAHDVAGTGPTDQGQIDVFGDQRLHERLPRFARAGGQFVREVNPFHPCSRCRRASSLANLTGARLRHRVQKPRCKQ